MASDFFSGDLTRYRAAKSYDQVFRDALIAGLRDRYLANCRSYAPFLCWKLALQFPSERGACRRPSE